MPGTLFDFGPDGFTFDAPVTITLEYDPAALPEGTDEGRLRLARIDTEYGLVPITERDTVANRVSAEVDHFTFFGVLLPRLVPDFVARIEVTEQIGVSDSLTRLSTLEPVQISVTETVGVSDALGLPPSAPTVTADESVTVTDAVSLDVLPVVEIQVTETVSVTDDVAASTPATLYIGSATGSVEVLLSDLTPVTSLPLPGFPGDLAVRPGTDELWAVERGSDSVLVFDLATDARLAAEYSATLDPIALDFDAAGTIAVIGDNNADRIVIFDAATRAPDGAAQSEYAVTDFGLTGVGDLAVSADGSTAWIVRENVAKVSLTAGSRVPLDTADVGGMTFASEAELSPDESELWAYDATVGNIVVYDAGTLAVLDTVSVSGGTTTGEESLVFSPDGSTVYATTATGGELVLIDPASRLELTRWALGNSAGGLALDPLRNLVYVASGASDDEIMVFDLTSQTVIARATLSLPRGGIVVGS